jgi:hypothetical protein
VQFVTRALLLDIGLVLGHVQFVTRAPLLDIVLEQLAVLAPPLVIALGLALGQPTVTTASPTIASASTS